VDRDWRLTYVNAQATELFAAPRSKLLGKVLWDEVPEFASSFYKDMEKARRTNTAVSAEGFYPPLSKWLDLRAHPTSSGLLVYLLDVTARKKAEETLSNREAYFRSLIENAHDIIFILNADGKILYQSPSVERVLGYRADEMVGADAFAFIHSEDVASIKQTFDQALRLAASSPPLQFRSAAKDGSWRVLQAVVSPTCDMTGTPHVVVNSRDVTEQEKANEALRESEGRLSAILDIAPDAIISVDESRTIQMFNRGAEKIFGYTTNEAIGQPLNVNSTQVQAPPRRLRSGVFEIGCRRPKHVGTRQDLRPTQERHQLSGRSVDFENPREREHRPDRHPAGRHRCGGSGERIAAQRGRPRRSSTHRQCRELAMEHIRRRTADVR
jgi:PAS domain S-box-containing protein